jgi:hypothetical protein
MTDTAPWHCTIVAVARTLAAALALEAAACGHGDVHMRFGFAVP